MSQKTIAWKTLYERLSTFPQKIHFYSAIFYSFNQGDLGLYISIFQDLKLTESLHARMEHNWFCKFVLIIRGWGNQRFDIHGGGYVLHNVVVWEDR